MDAMSAIFDSALQKYREGCLKYGDYDPLTDRRDMLIETEEEILDAINYLAMFMMKLRAMRKAEGLTAERKEKELTMDRQNIKDKVIERFYALDAFIDGDYGLMHEYDVTEAGFRQRFLRLRLLVSELATASDELHGYVEIPELKSRLSLYVSNQTPNTQLDQSHNNLRQEVTNWHQKNGL